MYRAFMNKIRYERESIMEADIRVVRLTRKIIRDQKQEQIIDESEQSDYFATDYFDVMKVEKKDLSSPLTSIMGIWPDERMDVLDVAAQSYSLYCNEEMMALENDKKECGDPFYSGDIRMQFLSMIQVHITPEVMAHAFIEKSAKEVIDAVCKDLHDAVSEYITKYKSDIFVYRIYKMLSAGDFAIVLRSGKAETSFRVSSLLRRRIMNNSGGKKIVLYKTYTLLTFGSNIIKQEIEDQGNNPDLSQDKAVRKDRFVLRCCYSNLYWSNKESVDAYLKETDILSRVPLYGLNGRYDFSVRITEEEFLELLQDIKAYKETGMMLTDTTTNTVSEEDGIVGYMRYLMRNRYLSYINERYLVAQDGNSNKSDVLWANQSNTAICASDIKSRSDFLDIKINEIYKSVSNKCQRVQYNINQIKDYRKNMRHYMNLLDKLIKLCYGINGFSDTRIYSAVLLEQLGVVMDSIEVYVEMYHRAEKEAEKEEIISMLEQYIRQSVCALDGYAQYIRNNNLQSLQTPNYNIESSMGMEKLLIGYSEFLRVFMEFYQRKKEDPGDNGNQCKYLPIVVPVLANGDLSVEILFPRGVMNDWGQEEEIGSDLNCGKDRRCMVISVPTLAELGNVVTMVTSLFHEVAHQFRYESRKERNDALLQYMVHTVMRDIINNLIHKLQNDTGLRDWDINVGRSLETSLVEAYLETNYMDDERKLKYSFQEAPLNNFQHCLLNDLYEILKSWEQKGDIRSVLRAFLKEIMHYYQAGISKCTEAIEILDELFGQMEKGKEQYTLSDQAVKCAYGLAMECAYQSIDSDAARIWGNADFREWIADEEEFGYQEKWVEVFGNMELGSEYTDVIEKIWNNFYIFASWIYDYYGNDEKARIYNSIKRTQFLQKAYHKICEKWDDAKIQADLNLDYDSTLAAMGRALGIDCNTKENYRIFEEQITFVVYQNFDYIVKMASWRMRKYREETADMFMCNAMKLTPFGYMHMLAANWPSNRELPNVYSSRSLNLLLFQWCLNEKFELSYDKFRKLCVELIRTLEGAISGTAARLIGMGETLNAPQYMDGSVKWDNDEEKQVINLLDRIVESIKYCEEVEENIVHSDDRLIKRQYKMLKFYGIIAHMMEQLVDKGKWQIEYFNDFRELRDDYIRGIKHLKNLNDEMCKDGDSSVQQLGEFCKEISIMQNQPHLVMESAEQNEKTNAGSIEFLLNMYYVNKRRIALQIGGE